VDDHITSTQNPRVKAVAALARKKARDADGRYLVEGPHAVAEALTDGLVVELFVSDEAEAAAYRDRGVPLTLVSAHVLERLADAVTPQGVVAVARQRPARLEDVVGRGFLIVCEAVSDPGNAGTIVRTADAAGAAGVVLTTGSVDAYNPKTVRAAAGSLTHLPVVTGVSVAEVASACRGVGQELVGLDAAGADDVFGLERRTAPVALVFGSEAHGLSVEARDAVGRTVAIPRLGRAESLNLATAVAVTAYAAARADLAAARG
jgi:TrmH family RNA methyltransferase